VEISYKSNQWRESEETNTVVSAKAYKLLKSDKGILSGQEIGNILYQHYIKGKSAKEIDKNYKGISPFVISGVIAGCYCPEGFNTFFDMVETEPEQLIELFMEIETNE
jgi:hypothetical protein